MQYRTNEVLYADTAMGQGRNNRSGIHPEQRQIRL